MAKQAYKIPADLDATYLDMEIAIQNKDGIGVKPLPIKIILTYIASAFLCFYACNKTIISRGSAIQIILFIILWVLLTLQLARFDKTKQMQAQLIPTLFSYIPKSNRHIMTRKTNKANAFYSIAGIEDVDKDSGLVRYTDDTYGYWYRVVGSASILLFEDDKNAILQRVDSFYRKIGTDCECIFVTTKEAQRVFRQVANLSRRYEALTVDDPDLLRIADEQLNILQKHVGSSFKSIHQYLIIKADNKEALMNNKNVLQSEIENSSLMLKQCIPLYYDDINEVLRIIYRGRTD